MRRLVTEALELDGFAMVTAYSGAEAIRLLGPSTDLVALILDIGLPDADGRDVLGALRSAGQQAPALFLTAHGALHDLVSGFAAGADDYLAKPFAIAELVMRVKALSRRVPLRAVADGALVLDPTTFSVRGDVGERVLTPTEYRLAAALLSRPGEVVRRAELVAAGWPLGAYVSGNTLDSYIRRLRRGFEAVAGDERIQTVRGVGYVVR